MSTSQFHRSAAVNESNIPIPKRMGIGIKKSKRCAQLPELQKYIETIIRASNEGESEDTSLSDRDKFPKEKKYGRHSVNKGIENKVKNEKIKNEFNISRSKSFIKPKTTVSEAVSRGVQINSNSLAPEFEDPRNWNLTKPQNLGPSVEIEKFLKQFYPNPYRLENVNEFKDSKIDDKDQLRDGTLPDVVISKANIHTEVDIEKTDNDLETADIEIKPCKRENKQTSLLSNPTLENCEKSPSQSVCNNNKESASATRTSSPGKIGNVTSNTSSQASSAESLSELIRRKESQMNFKKRKTIKSKTRIKPQKSEPQSDYDIGKLKLLSLTDSDDSVRKEENPNNVIDPVVDEKISSHSEEAYKTEELNDLKEIYDMMYKATESFLYISSKKEELFDKEPEKKTSSKQLKSEDEKLGDYDNDIQLNESNRSGSEISPKTEEKSSSQIKLQENDNSLTENGAELKNEEKEIKTVGNSLINVLLKEDKFEFKSSPEDTEAQQMQEKSNFQADNFPKHGEDILEPKEQKKEEQNNSNQDYDEVLEYMYDCLKKFNNKKKPGEETPLPESDKILKKTTSCRKFGKRSGTEVNLEKPTTSESTKSTDFLWTNKMNSSENLLEENFPQIRNIQNKYAAALSEINKKTGNKMRCQKRLLNVTPRDPPFMRYKQNDLLPPISGRLTASRTNMRVESHGELAAENNEDGTVLTPVTAESQNELGGCAEEIQEAQTNEDLRLPKPVLPLSVKRKKSKMNTSKKLKDVLEAEEKLFSVQSDAEKSKTETEELKSLITCTELKETVESPKVYSRFGDFRRTSSNFVVCVNSFPQNMKSVPSIRPNLSVPVSVSLGDLKKASFKQVLFCPKLPLKKITLPVDTESYVLIRNYNIHQEVSRTLHKTEVKYTAQSVCLKLTTNLSNLAEEASLKTSECLVQIIVKPVEESLIVESENALISSSENKVHAEDDKPVEALIEAVEDTEEKVFLLENRTDSTDNLYARNSEIFTPSERWKFELSENEVGRINDKKKIQELLLRTYNLQQKLQQYLHKITSAKPATVSCPLMQHNRVADANLKNKTELEVQPKSSLPVVHWHLKTVVSDVKTQADESVTVNISMVDHGTSYEPPSVEETYEKADESNKKTKEFSSLENEDGFSENMRNDEDDRSSTYSFKSSNDFSVTSETPKPTKENKDSENTSKKYYKKIFNEIELFRQSFEADKIERQQQDDSNTKEMSKSTDRQLTRYDPRIPAKVLKTVFKGKKSLTELTIGLKDVPMTKVGNISVEKTKFSPNHTKISISISKEKPELPHNKLSSFYFDQMRPSLSTCMTDYSRLKDDDSKTSQSLNEETDDDDDDEDNEDDYKSVGSTLGNSDTELDEEEKTKRESKRDKTPEAPPPKNYTKHRFDFYRKMNSDFDSNRSRQKLVTSSVCRYKELEPLKQALTEMQIRMRNIKREAIYDSNDYFERALKLAKMSAGFCQSCGNRAVIPNDTFGYYKTLLPRRYSHHRRNRHFRPNLTPNPSVYSLRSSEAEISDQFYDLGIKHNSYLLNPRIHSNRTVLRTSLHDMPILYERM